MLTYSPRKGDELVHQGERLMVTAVDGGMVLYKGLKTTGRVNLSTWTGMWKDAKERWPVTS